MFRILGKVSFPYGSRPMASVLAVLLVGHGGAHAVANAGADSHAFDNGGISGFSQSTADREQVLFRQVRAAPAVRPPGELPQALVFGGPVSGTLQNARTECTFLDSTHGFALHVTGILEREKLELFVNLTGGFNGPGVYPIGSVLGQSGQAALSYRNGAYTTDAAHPGSLQVNPDGHSGTISANMAGVSVTGTWSCPKLGNEQERLTKL